MSQIKVPPTGQHTANHLNEGQQKAVGSALLWHQTGDLYGDGRRPTVFQELQRTLDCGETPVKAGMRNSDFFKNIYRKQETNDFF